MRSERGRDRASEGPRADAQGLHRMPLLNKARPLPFQAADDRAARNLTVQQCHFIRMMMAPESSVECMILVVDDDPDILQTLALCLSTEGYRVTMAANGQEALTQLERDKPACILLDLMMPVMDGWQFVAELDRRGERKAAPPTPHADRAVQGHAAKPRAGRYLREASRRDQPRGEKVADNP